MGRNRNNGRPARLTKKEAAAYLGISPRQLDEYRQAGRIPALKFSHKVVRYDTRDLDNFIKHCREVL